MALLDILPRICTVPAVQQELSQGVDTYPYLERATQSLDKIVPVVDIDESVRTTAAQFETRLDDGEAQALAVAVEFDGILVTDDGPARSVARETGVTVTGSIGVLIRGIEEGNIEQSIAADWLKQWVDETDYRAPSRDLTDYLE
jgi:predicted nucleic acid-binding protein